MTTPNPTFDEKRRILAGHSADGYLDDIDTQTIYDWLMEGIKGYEQMTDAEVEEEWTGMFGDTPPDELEEIIERYVA